ncbi:unnamed protein product [Amoebophrya sp. A120]|nr:unnamed protein product [Amoebophrya sp. A120]|eukprot:GSA120T00018077001.1
MGGCRWQFGLQVGFLLWVLVQSTTWDDDFNGEEQERREFFAEEDDETTNGTTSDVNKAVEANIAPGKRTTAARRSVQDASKARNRGSSTSVHSTSKTSSPSTPAETPMLDEAASSSSTRSQDHVDVYQKTEKMLPTTKSSPRVFGAVDADAQAAAAHTDGDTLGNPLCFEDGAFAYEDCCLDYGAGADGVRGNKACWDEIYSYDVCCFQPRVNVSDRNTLFGCENTFFRNYRRDAWIYFKFQETHPRMFQAHAKAVANWVTHKNLCPPAVLVTILIKLEEDLAMKPLHSAFFGLLQYTAQLQEMVKSGAMGEREFRKWPLDIGWEHLQSVLPGNSKHAKFLAQYESQKKSVELVLPYCKEPAARILDWYKEAFTRFVKIHLTVTVILKCGDTPQLRQVPHQVFNHTKELRFLQIEDEDVRGDECSGYFGFLEKRYTSLADYTMFVHPDADEHIMINVDTQYDPHPSVHPAVVENDPYVRPNPDYEKQLAKGVTSPEELPSRYLRRKSLGSDNILEAALHAALVGNIPNLGYQNLAHNRDTSPFEHPATTFLFQRLFKTNVRPQVAPRSYCCSHFIVSKHRIRLRPESFYRDARLLFTTHQGYTIPPFPRPMQWDLRARTLCQNMMKFWHLVFGHPQLRTPLRHRDRTVPYFLKGRNFKPQYENE